MKIRQLNIFTYQLPLIKSLQIKDHQLIIRDGTIVQITADNKQISYGEAAPLPGLHKESIEDVLKQLAIIQSKLTGAHIPNISGIFGFLNTVMSRSEWLPSVRFGIETALLNLYLYEEEMDQSNRLIPKKHDYVLINILADGTQSDILKAAKRGLDEGYQAIKIKVGRQAPDEEIKQVKSLYKMIKGKATLRLDANQAWDLQTGEYFIKAIEECEIEYIEEPLRDYRELPTLFRKTGVPIAIDENVNSILPSKLKENNWIDTIVLKPGLIGSVQTTLEFISHANDLNLRCVISDTFHTGIGLAFLIRLSACLDQMIPMGFDTYRCLKEDVLKNRLKVTGGCFNLNNLNILTENVDYSMLREFSGSLSLLDNDPSKVSDT